MPICKRVNHSHLSTCISPLLAMIRAVLQTSYLPLVQYKPYPPFFLSQVWLVKMPSNLLTMFFQKNLCWTMQFHLKPQTSVSKQRTLWWNVIKMRDLPFVEGSHSCWILFQGMRHPTACSACRTSGTLTQQHTVSPWNTWNLKTIVRTSNLKIICMLPGIFYSHALNSNNTELSRVSYSNTVCGMYSSWYIKHGQNQPYSNTASN
jgi:hypothetical protein